MIIKMKQAATKRQVEAIGRRVEAEGLEVQINVGQQRTVIGVFGDTSATDPQVFRILDGVEDVIRITSPFKMASRSFREEDTVVEVNGVKIGGKEIVVMAGPCAVESEEQIIQCARLVKKAGGKILRGGAFKPRSSPHAWRGLAEKGLKLLARAKEETGLPIVTEVLDSSQVLLVSQYADILQIGARNMQNFTLLEAVSQAGKPVLLKRGMAATPEEWLMAADYLLKQDKCGVILCERGIRTFSNVTRFTADVGAIPVVQEKSHLPVIGDPSHSAGYFGYVPALARAYIAAGASGLIIEIHPHPKKARCDGSQALTFSDFERLMGQLKAIASAIGREI